MTSLIINDITEIREKEFTISLNAYLAVRWTEPRISSNSSGSGGGGSHILGGWESIDTNFIKLGHKRNSCKTCAEYFLLCRQLWTPNVLFINIRDFKDVSGLQDESGMFVRQTAAGVDILYVQLAEINFMCPMR